MSTSDREAYETVTGDRRGRPYWYFITRMECPMCGRSTTYRERRYTPRPTDPAQRNESVSDDGCASNDVALG